MKYKVSLLLVVIWTYALGGGEIQLYQKGKIEELKLPFYRTWVVDVSADHQEVYESYGISYSRAPDTSELRAGFTEEFFRLHEFGEIVVTLGAQNAVILSGKNKQINITDPYLHNNLEKY